MAAAKTQPTEETENGAVKSKKEEAKDKSVNGDGADWEEIARTKEVDSDNGHHAHQRSHKETSDFPAAGMASENALGVEPEESENENPNWNKEENLEDIA